MRLFAFVLVLFVELVVGTAAFAQNPPPAAPARTCQGLFNALRGSMGDTPRCLTAPEADQLQRLCGPGRLSVDREYMEFVRATPACNAIDLNVLRAAPAPTPLCEMGATPVVRGGVTVSCTCPPGNVLVRVGRRHGCAMAGSGSITDLILQTLAHGASEEQCQHAGITPQECASLRRGANGVTSSNVGEFDGRLTALETRLTAVEGRVQVADQHALEALRQVREVREQVNGIEERQARGETRTDGAFAAAERAESRSTLNARSRTRHAIGVGTLVLATNGSAYPYALATAAWQMRVPLTSTGRSFFVLDAQVGVGGAERFGVVLGGSLAATLEYCLVAEFCAGAGLVGTGMGILWRDTRFPDGNNAAWAAGLRIPFRLIPVQNLIISFFGDLTFGRATTVVDVTTPAAPNSNTPATTREAVTRTPTTVSGGGGFTIQYLF